MMQCDHNVSPDECQIATEDEEHVMNGGPQDRLYCRLEVNSDRTCGERIWGVLKNDSSNKRRRIVDALTELDDSKKI